MHLLINIYIISLHLIGSFQTPNFAGMHAHVYIYILSFNEETTGLNDQTDKGYTAVEKLCCAPSLSSGFSPFGLSTALCVLGGKPSYKRTPLCSEFHLKQCSPKYVIRTFLGVKLIKLENILCRLHQKYFDISYWQTCRIELLNS